MSDSAPIHATMDDWIAREAISFSLDSPATFNAAVDRMMGLLGDSVELLGFGEALHGGEEILVLRNRLFERLVEGHGYSAIAIESSFPRSAVVNEYVSGRGAGSYEGVRDAGFSHEFGRLEANRELVEWMRRYNADPSHGVKLRFYGFDSPTEMMFSDSPRRVLDFVLDYIDGEGSGFRVQGSGNAGEGSGFRGQGSGNANAAQSAPSSSSLNPEPRTLNPLASERRRRIDSLLGQDSDWENPAAAMDPSKSVGLSPAAAALRIETEDLIAELRIRRPELVALSDEGRYLEALHYASVAQQLLTYHAAMARNSSARIAEGLGLRDAMMADNLAYMVGRERARAGGGKVLAFAHNMHLKRGRAEWQLGPHAIAWWPAGAQLHSMLGRRYAVIGSGVGVSEANGIGRPEAGTLEARLTAAAGPGRLIATHGGRGIAASAIAGLVSRTGSGKNPSYFALGAASFTDFDWLVVLDSTGYTRGGRALP